MNKKSLIATALIATLATAPALADPWRGHDRDGYVARARVINVEPIRVTEHVPTRYRECYQEQREHVSRGPASGAGTVMGAVVGGVVGNHLGDRHSRPATTVLGALVGGVLGNQLSRGPGHTYTTNETRCDRVPAYVDRERTVGYRVTYRYQGQVFTQQMDHDPGRWVRVNVTVTPID